MLTFQHIIFQSINFILLTKFLVVQTRFYNNFNKFALIQKSFSLFKFFFLSFKIELLYLN